MIKYKDFPFIPSRVARITQVNTVVDEYQAKGFDLTLRQLYYQFVARGWISNTNKEYKRLGSIVNDGRLAGLIDWDAINDRTRNVRRLPTWDDPAEIVRSCAQQFKIDMWEDQECRIEVWIEKDALVGVIQDVCDEFRVPYFACRGYVSQSEMWAAGMRFHRTARGGQKIVLLHFGDHDPSGIDMSRDIEDRIRLFMSDPEGGDDLSDHFEIDRLALNMPQIRQYNPPPNPAKVTDIRYEGYVRQFGTQNSWELDALDPDVIAGLARAAVVARRNDRKWNKRKKIEDGMLNNLQECSLRWDDVTEYLKE